MADGPGPLKCYRPNSGARWMTALMGAMVILVGVGCILMGLMGSEERFDSSNAIGTLANSIERMEYQGLITRGLLVVCAGLLLITLASLSRLHATMSETGRQ